MSLHRPPFWQRILVGLVMTLTIYLMVRLSFLLEPYFGEEISSAVFLPASLLHSFLILFALARNFDKNYTIKRTLFVLLYIVICFSIFVGMLFALQIGEIKTGMIILGIILLFELSGYIILRQKYLKTIY